MSYYTHRQDFDVLAAIIDGGQLLLKLEEFKTELWTHRQDFDTLITIVDQPGWTLHQWAGWVGSYHGGLMNYRWSVLPSYYGIRNTDGRLDELPYDRSCSLKNLGWKLDREDSMSDRFTR
jgi:hypothetical protein